MSKKNTPNIRPISYSFHGSNSSHSEDHGTGGRTYHVPNYATSYANEKSKLIDISFNENQGSKSSAIAVILAVILFFVAVALPVMLHSQRASEINLPARQSILENGDSQVRYFRLHDRGDTVAETDGMRQLGSRVETADVDEDSEGEAVTVRDSSQHIHSLSSVHWENVRASDHCSGYGTREYTAQLRNVPLFTIWMEVCRATEVEIHGVVVKSPEHCKRNWPFGEIFGHWTVSFNEVQCLPHWGKFYDKGCISEGSKLRRFESRLWNIQSGEDWTKMCKTTPADVNGMHFDEPTVCYERGIWGVYGVWELDDANRC